jgi:hypothetical protein
MGTNLIQWKCLPAVGINAFERMHKRFWEFITASYSKGFFNGFQFH